MSVTELDKLIVSIEANTSKMEGQLRSLQSTVDSSLAGVERRTDGFKNVMTRHFVSLSAVTRNLTVGFGALEAIRFGQNLARNFETITENARSLGIAVSSDVVDSMRRSQQEWDRSWTEMQASLLPIVALMERLANLATLVPRGIAAAVNDITRQQPTGQDFMNRDTTHPTIAGVAAPGISNLDFAGNEARRQQIMKEVLANQGAVQDFTLQQSELQRSINNQNFGGTSDLREKIISEHKAQNDAILQMDQDLAQQQLSIDNENFAATERMRQQIMNEKKSDADAIVKFQQDLAQKFNRFNAEEVRGVASEIANFGDTMQQAGGKFGKAVELMVLDIAKLIAKLEIAKTIEMALDGPGASGGSILKSIGSFILGPGRAGGGDVYPGHFYPIGEKGPELFAPAVPGRIIPNGSGARAAAAPVFNIVQNIAGNGDAALADAVKQAHYQAVRTIKQNFPAMMTDAQNKVF